LQNIKLPDLNTTKLSSAMKIEGTAKYGYLHCRLNQNKQVLMEKFAKIIASSENIEKLK
jgi:hypothetical protein